jgi:hypothetical protein
VIVDSRPSPADDRDNIYAGSTNAALMAVRSRSTATYSPTTPPSRSTAARIIGPLVSSHALALAGLATNIRTCGPGPPGPQTGRLVRGYKEEGTTTTPFDMVGRNDLDRFHLARRT